MKKLFSELFYVPKHGRVSDKAMLARVVLTSVIMIVCLVAMSTSAYAFFSCDITSGSNHIEAADFSLNITITTDGDSVEVVKTNSQTHTAMLKAGESYTVNLSRVGTAQTGFCVISAANAVEPLPYHTRQLEADGSDSNSGSDTLSFCLQVTVDTTVSFTAHWGTSSHYPDFANGSDEDELYITEQNNNIVIQIKTDNKAGGSTSSQNQSTSSTTPVTDAADTSASVEQMTTVTTTDTLQTTTTEPVPSTSTSAELDVATTSVTLAATTDASTTTTATTPKQ